MASIMECIQAEMSYECNPDTSKCWCNGSGWVISDWDSQHECPFHYKGQPNSECSQEEWDIWMDNMHGNEQFMIIPYTQHTNEYWSRGVMYVQELGYHENDMIADAWVHHMEMKRQAEEDLPF